MSSSNEMLSCFKAYDIRGRLGEELNEDIAYRIGRATAQHLKSKDIVIGYDARETSKSLAEACARGINDGGAHVLNIGLCGTEEVYWAVNSLKAEAGIEVTASHNPIEYNGMKIVKAGSKPLDDEQDFQVIKKLASVGEFAPEIHNTTQHDRAEMARAAYVQKLLSFVSSAALKPLKIVVNSGNGAAGPTFDALENGLKTAGVSAEFIRVHHDPDPSFPNGIPNPLLPENHAATADVVLREGADFGVAFDGDFDRCFLFDETGAFVPGEYIIGLLANVFLEKEEGARIVHDPRVVWNTRETVSAKGGEPIVSKTGHAFIKATMRECDAIYGGEMSAHHYFRDFAYCDSGMIPWLLIWELISKTGKSLGALLTECRENFPSSGEQNFKVSDATGCLSSIKLKYQDDADRLDELDGVSMEFKDWRFNVRKSNTEPLVRLNVETRGDKELLREKAQELIAFIKAS